MIATTAPSIEEKASTLHQTYDFRIESNVEEVESNMINTTLRIQRVLKSIPDHNEKYHASLELRNICRNEISKLTDSLNELSSKLEAKCVLLEMTKPE